MKNYGISYKRPHKPIYQDEQYLIPVNQGRKTMFGWQQEAFDLGCQSRFFSIQAFCGSGKSLLQVNLAVHDIVNSKYKQKQLFVVPQEHIHRSFVGEDNSDFLLLTQKGVEYDWIIQPQHNFCEGLNRTERIKQWLLSSSETLAANFQSTTISGLNAVCSHSALCHVWNKMTRKEKDIALYNLTLRIDEAHHINNVLLETEDLTQEEWRSVEKQSTSLGKICKYILNSKNETVKLHLTTATMYRGDQGTILSKKVRDNFTEYNLDWLKHFETLGINAFDLEYKEYDTHPLDLILENIIMEPKEKHLVVIPSTGTKWRQDSDKYLELFSNLTKRGFRVLDLVNQQTQDSGKVNLLNEPKQYSSDNPSKYDVVITCMLGREGTDWCPCSRIHNSACESSITLAVQTVGRLFRRFAEKERVKSIHYVKRFAVPQKGVSKRDLFSDRTNAILTSIIWDDMINPILIQSFKIKTVNLKPTVLSQVFGDHYPKVLTQLIQEYEALNLENRTEVYLKHLISNICGNFNINKSNPFYENIQNALIVRILRETSSELRLKGIDVEFLRTEHGFDKIKEKYSLDKSVYFGGHISDKDFKIIQDILNGGSEQEQLDYLSELLDRMDARGGRQPLWNSESLELQDYKWLSIRRQKYSAKRKGIFYQSLVELSSERGYPDLFITQTSELKALKNMELYITFMRTEGRVPSNRSSVKEEKILSVWITSVRMSRNNKQDSKTRYVWHPFLDEIADQAGYPDLFKDQFELDLRKLTDICTRLKSSPLEKDDKIWIQNKRRSKNLKDLTVKASSLGYPKLFCFTFLDRHLERFENIVVNLKKLNKKYPSKGKDSVWIIKMRNIKFGIVPGKWNSELDELAEELGYSHLFEFTKPPLSLKGRTAEERCLNYAVGFFDRCDNRGKKLPGRDEWKDYTWLEYRKVAKSGKKRHAWYSSLEDYANQRGYFNIFDRKSVVKSEI